MLLKQKVDKKQISPLLADTFVQNAKNRYCKNDLIKYSQGSTYVSFNDMIKIQLYESSAEKEIKIVKDNPERERIIHANVKRSWQPIINMLQTEDKNGYGTQFRSTPAMN